MGNSKWKSLLILYLLSLSLSISGYSQEIKKSKSFDSKFVSSKIKIDGRLSESEWNNASVANSFITYSPTNGDISDYKTEVKVLYSNTSVYVGAVLYDSYPDSIYKELSKRDDYGNTDYFTVQISPFLDGQNIFQFEVTAANVQIDVFRSGTSWDDDWNAVWKSEVSIIENAWIVEIEIPFSAIRFPKKDVQEWGINFKRQVRRERAISTWNFIDRNIAQEASQMGVLKGIEHVKPPFRLALFPYFSTYFEHESETNSWANSINGGMDIKLGINESYTLDMTLIPDFGQTLSDKNVLNLSPFEVRFSEKRQFFTEGTELFNKAGLFYSRRIGATPEAYSEVDNQLLEGESIVENPAEAQMINATKISGRSKTGFGTGFFNAVTADSYAIIKDSLGNKRKYKTQALTNYNIIVVDQAIGNHSFVNLINTNRLKPSENTFDNVSGAVFRLMDKNNLFGIDGKFAMSAIDESEDSEKVFGQQFDLSIGRFNGKWQYDYNINLMTDKYDHNAMGFMYHNNYLSNNAFLEYNNYDPEGYFLDWHWSLFSECIQMFDTKKYADFIIQSNLHGTTKDHLSMGTQWHFKPLGEMNYYESRVENKPIKVADSYWVNNWWSSDYRKTLALDGRAGYFFDTDKKKVLWIAIEPRVKVNSQFLFSHEFVYEMAWNEIGYAYMKDEMPVFGMRDRPNIINTFEGTYVFNNKMSLSLDIRHYWTQVEYLDYGYLDEDGVYLSENVQFDSQNINYNIFNIDLNFAWNFAPGSFLTAVWKNNINQSSEILNLSYFENFKNTIKASQTNSLSIKVIYYIDYQKLFRKKN